MANLVNLKEVLTYLQAEQVFKLSPGQAWVRNGRQAQPFIGEVTDRPKAGQIWPRGEYEATATIGVNQPEAPKFAATVTVTPPEFSIDTTGPTTQQLTARAFDAAGIELFGHHVTWFSSAPSKATVSQTGLVSPVAVGTSTISAVIDGAVGSALCNVFASPPAVASVTVTPDPFAVGIGQTVQMTAVVREAGGAVLLGRTVTWASTQTSKATVNGSGLVSGVAAGTFIINATCETVVSNDADGTTVPNPDISDPILYFSADEDLTTMVSTGSDKSIWAAFAIDTPNPTMHSGKGRKLKNVFITANVAFQRQSGSNIELAGNQGWTVATWFDKSVGRWAVTAEGGSTFCASILVWGGGPPNQEFRIAFGDQSLLLDGQHPRFLIIRAPGGLNDKLLTDITIDSISAGNHHLAVTNDPATNKLRVYLDGVQVHDSSAINVSSIGAGTLLPVIHIGGRDASFSGGFITAWGSVDEFYLFGRALSSDEVLLLKNS